MTLIGRQADSCLLPMLNRLSVGSDTMRGLSPPLTPYVDPLPVPRRLRAADHDGRLTVSMRAGTHRFHRDLPESPIWGFDGGLPGPTIEAGDPEGSRPRFLRGAGHLDLSPPADRRA